MSKKFHIKTTVWLYPGMVGWHFVTVPKETTEEIDNYFSLIKGGWGSIPVMVTIGKTNWKTSIFPDKKSGSYLLPLKKEVRLKEKISEGDEVKVELEIKD